MIDRTGDVRVQARVYRYGTLTQLRNVATLPGIRRFALVLPDAHQGTASRSVGSPRWIARRV